MKLFIPPSWRKSYHLFLLMAVIPFIMIIAGSIKYYDLHIRDTYFVIAKIHLALGISLPFLFIWLIYRIAERVLLSGYFTWIHITTTIIAVLGFVILARYSLSPDLSMPRRNNIYNPPTNTMTYLWPLLTLFIIGQSAFLINVFVGIIRELINPTPPPFIENI